MCSARFVLAFALLAAAPLCSFGQAAGSAGETAKAEQEVRRLERAWLDAYEQFDAKAMDAIVADDFAITFPNGWRQTKPQLMDDIRKPRAAGAPAMKFHTEDVSSRAYGDTVVLRGIVVTEYQREGRAVREQSSYTDTYVRRGGRWQVVASHLSNAPQPRK
ncbi:MAG TPA: nuclear transport factor 2 family protein [Pyrinomonadaceae bacterium]|nr:nuclear transport factor 2 family protein [Pyrinomonadaceae bacterium]